MQSESILNQFQRVLCILNLPFFYVTKNQKDSLAMIKLQKQMGLEDSDDDDLTGWDIR